MVQGDPDASPQVVDLNTHVEIELVNQAGESEHLAFDLVSDDRADFYSGLLGVSTPLAQAILGQTAGSLAPYHAADIRQVRILAVTAISQAASSEPAMRRQEAVQEALKQVERTNAMIFASTVEGKWGEYDADGMMENWDDDQAR
ncbi:MAG: GreA/GreB family elongation factor [Anaerolineales bacterium]|nr:GreA/GreB family elongation factor [Anaerolineales bacterium]